MSKPTKLNSRWTAFTLFVGGCAIIASAGGGLAPSVQSVPTVHNVPQAKYRPNVIPVHPKKTRNHTHLNEDNRSLGRAQKVYLFG